MEYDDGISHELYFGSYGIKLNISTALTNFNGGSISGNWSPDTF